MTQFLSIMRPDNDLLTTSPTRTINLINVSFHELFGDNWPQDIGITLYYCHYNDVIIGAVASQITSFTIVYSIVYSDADQRKHQSSASLAFVRGIHRGPVNSPHKWPVMRKMFPFDDIILVDIWTTLPAPIWCFSYQRPSNRCWLEINHTWKKV